MRIEIDTSDETEACSFLLHFKRNVDISNDKIYHLNK